MQRKPAARPKTDSQAAPAAATRIRRGAYFNRELSWLSFNRRVLEQARNPKNPLLERIKFLSIVSSNLDEFFEIRVAGLIRQVESGEAEPESDGLPPREVLRRVHAAVLRLVDEQYRCWRRELLPALAKSGIIIKAAHELLPAERAWIQRYFHDQVAPLITPQGIDETQPFPHLSNKTLNVFVSLEDERAPVATQVDTKKQNLTPFREKGSGFAFCGQPATRLAILPVPRVLILPRLVRICPGDAGPQRYVFLSDIIKLCAAELSPGYRVRNAAVFRVTRNSDLHVDEEEADTLLETIEERLRDRYRNAAVRLEIEDTVGDDIFEILCERLKIPREHVFRLSGPLNLKRLMSLTAIDRPDLKYPAFTPVNCSPLAAASGAAAPTENCKLKTVNSGGGSAAAGIFDILRERDVMLHHPYDSFAPVVDFVEQAARDPQVLAIKQTLYRTSADSPVVRALVEASRNGKQVAALVELKARFDEANNIHWARQLEDAGVHVVYGITGYKTHCKCSLVVRREGDALRRYVHLGTGNYNPTTARLYTDLSLFTAREHITADVASLFNTLGGFNHVPARDRAPVFTHLIVAPFDLHERIQELIRRETENAKAGRPARIIAKMNSLVDPVTIDNLYEASRAGVKIDLIVRGICCLIPGIRGRSENIRVRSIVGRYLEHARVFYFENAAATAVQGGTDDPVCACPPAVSACAQAAQAGLPVLPSAGAPLIYAGSADWMPRNFFRRVEVLYPVESPEIREWITREFLPTELRDNENARELRSNGAYVAIPRPAGAPLFSAQTAFMENAARRAAAAAAAAVIQETRV